MIVQYTAAAIVNEPRQPRDAGLGVFGAHFSNAEDHVSMGANEARHVLAMAQDLGRCWA